MLTPPSARTQTISGYETVLDAASAFVKRLKAGCHVMAAVSGGSDSLGLLAALAEAAEQCARRDIMISAATVDHGLRVESADEAATVARFCVDRGIAHQTLAWRGEKPATGLMAAARDARYRLLADHAARIGADVIAVAHTLDDQAETLEMRKARNPDPPVSGMAAETLVMGRVWVARPFLSVSRQSIRDLLVARGIVWFDDPSNANPRYERVRVRRSLGGAVSALGAEAVMAGHMRARLSEAAAAILASSVRIHGAAVAEIDLEPLARNPDAARYLLNVLAAVIGGETHGPGKAALADILNLAEARHGARMTAGRCLFERQRERLLILREQRGLRHLEISAQTAAVWDGRWRIENRSDAMLVIGPAGTDAGPVQTFAALPPRLSKLARATAPCVRQGALPESVGISRILSPYQRYLPGFDLALANRLAAAFGISPFPAPAYFSG
ncbi:tRNA lysidine(34) synthetase TilS [Martelella soudanensis]|uniref:tRNA lysidine(34) synthetase TilS n=1 Tax=unclassified Martelella TaxID=2629616 RepID=UPI0015DE2EDB|nr:MULTISPECIES: tRNA lysidine(34) synthetase TilS [unclassified Martelella]